MDDEILESLHFISIHALLAESDHFLFATTNIMRNFYPRSPCGERQYGGLQRTNKWKFLSTLSLRRATPFKGFAISILAFLSTLSLRRATQCGLQ